MSKIIFLFIFTREILANVNTKSQIDLVKDILNSDKAISVLSIVGCFDEGILRHLMRDEMKILSTTYITSPLHLNRTTDTPWAHRKLYVTDFVTCPKLLTDFLKIDKYFLEHPFHWLIFVTEEQKLIFRDVPVLLASNVVLVLKNAEKYELIQVYKIRNSSEILRIENFGYWSNDTGLVDQRTSKIIARRRKNLHKELLYINTAMLHNDSFQYLYTYKGKEHDTAIRVCLNQMNIIVDTLNGTNKFMLTEKIGYDETGIWVGAYGSIINEHVDIATTPFFPLLHRLPLLDYIDRNGVGRAYFIFRFPNLSSVANIYVLPFSRILWLCLFACACFCIAALYFLTKTETILLKDEQKVTISDIILTTVSAICQMGSEIEPKLISTKIFIFFLFVTFVFAFTSYTANIVSLLQTPTKSIQTLEDLYNSKLKLGVEDNLYNRYYMGRTTDPIRLKIYHEKIAPPNSEPHFMDLQTGVALMRNSSFAFFAEGGPIYKEMEDTFFEEEKCGLNQIEYLEIIEPYQALKKNSPFREIMKTNLPKLREFGITQVEVNRMYKKRPQCIVSSGSRFESVSVESVRGAILLLPFGMLTAVMIFVVEVLHRMMIKRKVATTLDIN